MSLLTAFNSLSCMTHINSTIFNFISLRGNRNLKAVGKQFMCKVLLDIFYHLLSNFYSYLTAPNSTFFSRVGGEVVKFFFFQLGLTESSQSIQLSYNGNKLSCLCIPIQTALEFSSPVGVAIWITAKFNPGSSLSQNAQSFPVLLC